MYRVIELFHDLQDKNHCYKPGDEYPRKGIKVTKKRIAELSGKNNKRGIPLIEEVPEEENVEAVEGTEEDVSQEE